MKLLSIIIFSGIYLFEIRIANAQTTVEEYVQLAVENNPGLKAKFNAYYESLERVSQVGELPDPNIAFGAYILPVETRVGSRILDFEITQSFPWFGTLAAEKDEAAQWAKVKFREFQVSKTTLLFDVKSLYYELHSINASISIQNKYLQIFDQREKELVTRVEAAMAGLSDILRIQMQQKEALAELERLEDHKITLSARMNALLNRSTSVPVNSSSEIRAIEIGFENEILLDSILSNNSTIELLKETKIALESQKEVARLAGQPSLKAGISYGMIQRRTDMDVPNNGQNVLMPKVSLSIPLNRKKYTSMIKEVELRQNRVTLEMTDHQNTLTYSFKEVKNQYRNATRRVKLYQELTIQANQSLVILTTSYTTSLAGYDEILDMQWLLLSYQLELEKAKSNQNIAVASIAKLMAKGI